MSVNSLTANIKGVPPAEGRKMGSGALESPHAMSAAEVEQILTVSAAFGLSSAEIEARRSRYGANALQSIRQRAAWRMLADQFASLIILLLAVAAAVAWVTHDHLEAIAILVVLLINALVGFFTEWQAGRALDALRRQARTIARVLRDQDERNIDAEDLVPGDIILLSAGDRVPADARLVEAYNLQVEESALTGESTTTEKLLAPVAATAPLAERRSMLYLGTAVTLGRAVAV